MARNDASLLQAALVGYQAEAERIERAMADLQRRIGKTARSLMAGVPAKSMVPGRKKHRISAEGRRRIAEAQRKRWAAQKIS
jgi:hypothetical protein